MSGILGLVSTHDIVPTLMRGLHQLEQPGHNACGWVVHGVQRGAKAAPRFWRQRSTQKVSEWLADDSMPPAAWQDLEGLSGMAHTGLEAPLGSRLLPQVQPQWSHGPHATLNSPARVAVVHQGSLHNHQDLREALEDRGYGFKSQSDAELIAHLLDATHQGDSTQAWRRTLGLLKGRFALCAMFSDQPQRMFAAQHQLPLFIGIGKGHGACSTWAPALPQVCEAIWPLKACEYIEMDAQNFAIGHWG